MSMKRVPTGMKITPALCVLALAACGGGGDEWHKRPLETRTVKLEGVSLSIELPKGMRMKQERDEVVFDFLEGEYVKMPEVRLSVSKLSRPWKAEDVILGDEKKETFLRKEDLADGYVVSMENTAYKGKEDYIVRASKKVGDKQIDCDARVTPWSPGEKVKDKVALVEKMCLSVKGS
jgi:hypothetical protein